MVDSINNVTAAGGADAALRASPVKPKVQTEDVRLQAEKLADAKTPISPRQQLDYQTGKIVTQFVGSNGDVTLQVPSAAALAYLRAGLNAQGGPIEAPAVKPASNPVAEDRAADEKDIAKTGIVA